MNATAQLRFRIKGTTTYVDPAAAAMGRRFRADSAYTTAGTGPRSIRWRARSYGPNVAVESGAATLRNQSRDLIRKNPLASALVDRIVSNTVGTGIKPKLSDQAIIDLFTTWTDEADTSGMLDFYGLQAQAMAAVVTAGECFARLRVRRAEDNLSVPLQIEILEAEFVPMDKNEMLPSGNIVRNGIEFDANLRNKRVAYWMHRYHPDDMGPGVTDNDPVRVPASEVIHLYLPLRPGQVRGEPWMVRALARLKDVDAYDAAELQRKKVSALFVGFIRRPSPEGLSLDDLEEMYGEDSEISGGVGDVDFSPGSMNVLAPGEEVEFADPKDTGSQYETFMRAQHRAIAASVGVLYEQLTGDFSQVNDRTWRAAVMEFRRRCETWQHHLMVFQFCRPIFRRWSELAGLVGKGKTDALVQWTPPRWPYINPEQDIAAMKEEVLNGLTSRTRIVSERGEDASIIDAEIQADNERAKALRLSSDGTVVNQDAVALEEAKAKFAPKPVTPSAPKAEMRAAPAQQPMGIVLPEKMLTVDVARPTYTEIEERDEQGRIKTLLIKPSSGKGPTIRRRALHDEDGRLLGHQDEILTENTDG
jgi:lambda family phage portal protein